MSHQTFFSLIIGNCHTFLNLSGSSKDPAFCLKEKGRKKKKKEKKKKHELKIPVEPINKYSPHRGCVSSKFMIAWIE